VIILVLGERDEGEEGLSVEEVWLEELGERWRGGGRR